MHQYQVKIHYHHPVGDYFARDMRKSLSPSSIILELRGS